MSDHTDQHALPAGVTLKAVASLAEQTSFSRAQVAYLMHLAFQSGAADNLFPQWGITPPVTPGQRVAARLAEMEHGARREREWWAARLEIVPPRVPLDDVEWPDVAVPGGSA